MRSNMTDFHHIDWTALLLNANVDVPLDRIEFSTFCPFHSDTSPSCSINVE